MKIPLLSFVVCVALTLPIFGGQNLPGTMILDGSDLDAVTYTEWVDGASKEIVNFDVTGTTRPFYEIWSKKTQVNNHFFAYGDSKNPGVRYLSVGFKNPVTIGSILARAGGRVSVLKPGAAGDPADDSQWIAAERVVAGHVSDAEVSSDEVTLWTLPAPVATRAIRFTHTAQPSDQTYDGTLGGMALFPNRMANPAPQALAIASANDQHASQLNDGKDTTRLNWENIAVRDGDRPKTVEEAPEWAMLVWPKPLTLQGVALLGNEWGSAEIQAYIGPAAKHPREGSEVDWKTLRTLSGVKPQWPALLDVVPVFFDEAVTTRALRIRFTKSYEEKGISVHLTGHAKDGKRVGLAEWMALEAVNDAGLQTTVIPATAKATHAPIPIRFTLPEDAEVTLVIEDAAGKRIRNLVSQTPFPKGKNVAWWDGTDDLGRDREAADHGVYNIPAEFVTPGAYTVRGLWHKPLDLRYEFSVYSPGDPPWETLDHTGGWMTNHTPACCTLFVPGDKAPGGKPLVYIGAYVSEGGSALSWVDLDGKKIGGRGWIGGAWTGAQYLAADSGPGAEPDVYAYAGSVFVGNKKYGTDGKAEMRLTKLTKSADQPVLTPTYLCDPLPDVNGITADNTSLMGGLAVHNGLLVFSQTALNQMVFVDAKAGKMLGTAALPSPRGLAFDGQGRLLALSGKSLLRFTLTGAELPTLPTPETLVSGFEDPQNITVGPADNIYVSDYGDSQQVKVFSPAGTPLATIGHPGAPKAGTYDPLHMNHPKGLAVDSNGRLWVAEDDFFPKRVSVWNPDGTLWKDYFGNAKYGGGGVLDPKDKTLFIYDGMEFRLNWEKGTHHLARVDYRPGVDSLKLAFRDAPPEMPVYFDGNRYLTDAYNSGATNGHNTAFLFLDKGDVAVPIAGAGSANEWDVLKGDEFKSRWPKGLDPKGERWKNQAFFIWNDLNGDGKVQPDEVNITAGNSGGVTVGDDGSFLISRFGITPDTLRAIRFKPVRFTVQGAPVYDIASGEILSPAQGPGSDGGDQLLAGTDGWLVMTSAPPPFSKFGVGGSRNGLPMWSYPSLWPGLHASHSSPAADRTGMLIGTTRLLGNLVTPKNSEAGPLFFLNGNQGNIYVFTQDGLFVAQLFEDMRQGKPFKMPVATRNMSFNGITLNDENFWPAVCQAPDGKIYVITGKLASAIVRVDNLDTVHGIMPMQIKVSADDLKKAQNFVVARETERQAAQGSGLLQVSLLSAPPAVDAKLDIWNNEQWAQIDHRGVAAYFAANTKPYDVSGAVAVAGGKLFAAWKTGDPKLLVNAGDVQNGLFKTGGALDLMIGTGANANPNRASAVTGDERLLVAQVGGKTRALLYHAVVPGTPEKSKVPFTAPWHGITMDRVDDVSDQVELASDGSGNYEIAVPLSVLGLDPKPGMSIKGDIGILRGDGKQTIQRVYWTNKATAIVSDVPSEAELTPGLWGTWEFGSK